MLVGILLEFMQSFRDECCFSLTERNLMRHQSVGVHRSISRIVAFLAAGVASAAGVTFADDIMPAGTPSETRLAIQDAIDAAAVANPVGTVTLGSGTFEIDAQLMVTGGVTLVGQGWENTIVRQTAVGSTTRCATVSGGATIRGVTLTGGHTRAKFESGAGVLVENGTISWCCITNNQAGDASWQSVTVNNIYGAGVHIKQGVIDHSIIALNAAYANGGGASDGGGLGVHNPNGPILVDKCLIYGNRAPNGNGGGIYASFGNYHNLLAVRNTTIVGNEASGTGGGVYATEYYAANKFSFALVNSILADNTSGSEGADSNIYMPSDEQIVSGYAAQSSNNLFANGTTALGADSTSIAGGGSAWFVDAAGGDYNLTSTSPAVGAGTTYAGIDVDLGNVAFADPPAIGCYELRNRASEPVFNPESGSTFYPTTSVTLFCETAGAAIYYTTDGSIPNESSTLYTGPIVISETTTIKARAYKSGIGPSGFAVATYTCKRPTPPLSSFKKYVEITLSTNLASTAITAGIPALVKLSESTISGFRYKDFSLAKGGDMMFVDAESGAILPHEVDTWDTAGESLVWVRLPSTDEDTKIVLYYGNGAVSSEEPTDVWTDYVGVWHFNEATGATVANSYGTYANSTATTGIDGNVAQYAVTNAPGRFGKCFRTNNSPGYKGDNYNYGGVWVNDSGSNSPIDGGQNFTISGWFKHDNFQYSWDHIFYKREKSNNSIDKSSYKDAFAIECNASSGTTPNPYARGSSNTGGHKGLPNNLVDQWGYLTFVFDGKACHLYENGGYLSWVTIDACIDNDSPLVFGNNCNVAAGLIGDSAWNGWIDEVRYSNGSKSAEWVAAEYKAMNAGETDIFTYGAAERAGALSEMVIIVR